MAIPSWVWIVMLVTAITITVRFFFKAKATADEGGAVEVSGDATSSKTAKALETTDEIVKKTGFNEQGPTTTKTTTDAKTGAITTTTTDDKGTSMAVTTSKDGAKTTTTVKDADGKTLDTKTTTALDTAKALAPSLLMNIAAGEVRDLILIGGSKIISKASKEVAEKGVKSALQQGGKLVSRQGADLALKYLGYVTKEGAERAIASAAETGARKAAKEASERILAEQLKKAGKKTLEEVTDKAAKAAIEKLLTEAGEKAAKEAAEEALEKVAKKVAMTAAEKATAKMGAAAAAKIGAKAGVAAAKMGAKTSMGPVGWALMAFDVLSMALDIAGCGGFQEGPFDNKTWTKTRDTLIGQVKALVDDSNAEGDDPVRWPIITGPFDKLDAVTLQTRLIDGVKNAMKDPNNKYVKATVDKLKAAIAAKTITEEAQIDQFMEENLDLEGLLLDATKQLCTDLKGKIIMDADKFAGCSWPDQAQCEASFKWPIVEANQNDNYSVWNKEKLECNKDPVSQNMRGICEVEGFPFNKDTKICELSKDHCLKKGMQWDGTNCKLNKGQELAEMMFGTTVVRGLNALYSADQYEPCPPGARPAGEIAALAAGAVSFSGPGAVMLGTYLGQTLCATDQCPDGQEKQSGLCYTPCKKAESPDKNDYDTKADGITGAVVQGMCYRCDKGFKKTTAGMCQREQCPAGEEQGSGVGVGFCYKKCTDLHGAEYTENDGASICKKPCPAGMRTEPLTCMRDVDVKIPASAQKVCPDGWNQSIAGPGGMCRQNCTDGWKDVGGICYHPNVNTALLVKTPDKSACNAGDRDDGTSCWSPLKTDWCPGHKRQGCCHGPFWYICNAAVTTGGAIVKTLAQRQYCPAGYELRAGMCYAVSRPIQQSKPLLEVGQCRDPSKPVGDGGMCYQKCEDFGGSYKKTGPATCQMDAMSIPRTKTRDPAGPFVVAKPADQYSRPPLGISYKVFQKKRKIPFGKGPNGC